MKTIVNDTADVVFKRKSDGHIIFTAESQLASISQSVSEEKIKGGIGNKDIAVIRSEKEIELTVRNGVFDREWLAMSQGVAWVNGTATIYHKEENTIVNNTTTSTLEVTLTKTVSTGGDVRLYNTEGTELEITVSGSVVTVTDVTASAGDKVIAVYQIDVTGDTLQIQSDTFSEAYEVEYHTIEYSPETNRVVKDLYFQFDSVTPSDNFDLSFESGSAITPELNFTAKPSIGSNLIGKVVEVPRV